MVRAISLFVLFMGITVHSLHAQVDAFAQVRLSKKLVYAQEPIRATVSVYTATWFTQPLDFNNVQIPNAFIIPFSRTIPGVTTINGKQYAGLEFYYIIYPYKSGSYEIPVINIVAETPPVGDYKGKRVTLKTHPIPYTVRENPKNYGSAPWFVARNVSVTEHWNKPLSNIQVGDLVERTIRITAHGTLPNFIPELPPVARKGISTYPLDPQLIDQRNDQQANGTRIEKETFLFEKEGAITIPEETIQWWDPIRRRIQKKTIKAITVNVAPNKNLGMLASVRDSLNQQQPTAVTEGKGKLPLLIWGLPWKTFVILVLLCLAALYFIFRLMRKLILTISNRRLAYRQTEEYWFKKFRHSGSGEVIHSFYAWWDRLTGQHASMQESFTDKTMVDAWQNILRKKQNSTEKEISEFKEAVSAFRSKTKSFAPRTIPDHQQPWNF